MTPQQIFDDLRPQVRGRLAVDDLTRRLYSTDASPFQILPAAVFVPEDEADLAAAVKFAFERGLPIVPRGGGTGLAGESLTSGIALDLSVRFRRVLEFGPDWVRVQPGVTIRELNDALHAQGRRFAPDPANAEVATLGGAIATNASGGTAWKHGTTRDHVTALRVIWDDGTLADLPGDHERERAVRELILATRPPPPAMHGGYHLQRDLVKLLVGSEGTLAITAAATLRTVPLVGGTGQYALGFASLDAALDAGLALKEHPGIAGCDLLDQRLLSLARSSRGSIPAQAAAALIVTLEANDEPEALARATASCDILRKKACITLFEPAVAVDERQALAAFRGSAVFGFYSRGGSRRPEAFVEDIGVPPESLPVFLAAAQQILRESELAASFLVHVLTGQVHCRPIIDLADPAEQAKAWPLANRLFELALSLGGSISSQHGVGLARTPWIEKQFAASMPAFRELKRIFDPTGILNPGKILGPDPARPAWPFRSGGQGKPQALPLQFVELFSEEVKKCNGCGDCRVRAAPERMCPVFRVTGEEEATPRAKANALMAVLEQPERLSDDDVKAVAKLCVHCTRCRDECRTGIDIPTLMLEAKAAHYAAHGFDRGEWLVARIERLAGLAGTFAFTANLLLGITPSRWLIEKLTGLHRHRMMHRFTHRTFLRRRLFRRPAPGARQLAYFVDTFANFNDPLLAEATVAVLEHHGFAVQVPQRQRGSGLAPLSVGDVEKARANATYNVRTLAELVREGCRIVCSEPSAALALRTEYPRLLNTDDARLVAANTIELTALLGELHAAGELKPPTRELDFTVGHHAPCHLKTLGPVHAPELLARIPKLSVHALEAGCSGAAGPWGFAKVNHDLSLRIGAPAFAALDRPWLKLGVTECSTCRLQLQQGVGKRVLHPVQILALGYGLVPQLEKRLTRPLKPLLTG